VLEWVYGHHCVLLHVKCWCPVPQPLVYPVLEIDGTDVTELRSARCTGDTITDVMDTTRTSAGVSILAYLVGATFIVTLGAGSFGVVPLKSDTLRGVGTTIAGGGVGAIEASFLTVYCLDRDVKLELTTPSSPASLVGYWLIGNICCWACHCDSRCLRFHQ